MLLDGALRQLDDLPKTFRRVGPPYTQLIAALAAAATLFTEAVENTGSQTDFSEATAGWNDVWGGLPGITRRTGEADDIYNARLSNMLQAWRDSAVAIMTWLRNVEQIDSTVNENLPAVGYNLLLPANLSPSQLAAILKNLAYVRPAGVPFNFSKKLGTTYLNTVNYQGQGYAEGPWSYGGRVTGAYLTSLATVAGIAPPAATNNQQSTLPDLLLTPLFPGLAEAETTQPALTSPV